MILLIILVSFVLGASAFAWPDNRTRPRLLLVGAAIHLAGVISLWTHPEGPVLAGYIFLDAAGKVVLSTSSVLCRGVPTATTGSSWAACSSCSRP
jgi:hypothetical protein